MTRNSVNRRIFLKTSVLGVTGAILADKTSANESADYISNNLGQGKVVKRKLGKTGIELPVVSFGVMRADNPNLIKAAMSAGVKHFDTAHGYQNGNNEKMLGEILKNYPRESFTIATKVKWQSRDDFFEKLNTSLERLQMDYVDILYTHDLSTREAVLSEPMIEALKSAREQGKTRHIGLSTHSNEPEVIKAAIECGEYEVILTAYNFKQDHRDELTKVIEEASRAGIGIVAMKTMAGGRLGKDADKMHYGAAIKWALKNPHVHTSIPGITTFEELEKNLALMNNLDISREEQNFLSFAALQEGLYCNGCGQCVITCKKSLAIPDMMRAYMYAYGYGETLKAKQEITSLEINSDPCEDCSYCTAQCIKGFNVASKLADICRLTNIPDDFLV